MLKVITITCANNQLIKQNQKTNLKKAKYINLQTNALTFFL